MSDVFSLISDAWPDGGRIPERFAFGAPGGDDGPVRISDNISPPLRWSGAPQGTRSFALICHDPDVPSQGDAVNKEGMTIPASLPRIDFFHWVLVDIPAGLSELPEGAESQGPVAHGKPAGAVAHGLRGLNNYTDWFQGDPEMGGDYGGYDGPFPPWNDEIIHHYHFTLYALDVPSLGLSGRFGGPEARAAMAGHVLAEARWTGVYSLNPAVS